MSSCIKCKKLWYGIIILMIFSIVIFGFIFFDFEHKFNIIFLIDIIRYGGIGIGIGLAIFLAAKSFYKYCTNYDGDELFTAIIISIIVIIGIGVLGFYIPITTEEHNLRLSQTDQEMIEGISNLSCTAFKMNYNGFGSFREYQLWNWNEDKGLHLKSWYYESWDKKPTWLHQKVKECEK